MKTHILNSLIIHFIFKIMLFGTSVLLFIDKQCFLRRGKLTEDNFCEEWQAFPPFPVNAKQTLFLIINHSNILP